MRPEDRVLDWVPVFDERSRQFPVSALELPSKPRERHWRLHARLDQGREGKCVAYAHAHRRFAAPIQIRLRVPDDLDRLYDWAQQNDEWPGEAYSGTSVLAGAKGMHHHGWYKSYRWCFSLLEVQTAISHDGPVVAGTDWYEGMYNTDADGYVKPTGQVVGGHAYLIRGIDPAKRRFVCRNSWGKDWGVKGDFFLSFEDFEKLMPGGEFCLPQE